MLKLQHYLSIFLNIIDKISYGILLFIAFGTIFDLSFFTFNPDHYDDRIKIAHNVLSHLFLYLAILIILFLMNRKYPKIKYFEAFLWIVFIFYVPYLLHQLPSISTAYNQFQMSHDNKNWDIITIEYSFYVDLLTLAAISLFYKKRGRYALFFMCFWFLSHIFFVPEFEEIVAIESCNEGQCEVAENMGIVKLENDQIIYIPQHQR